MSEDRNRPSTVEDKRFRLLIDDRFGDSKVKQLLPRWWSIAPRILHAVD